MDVDDALNAIKPFGRYQILMTILYTYALCPSFVNNNFMAFDEPPKFLCKDNPGRNESLIPSQDCQVYYNCSKDNLSFVVNYFSVSHQWGLICEESYFVSLITSIQMAGSLLGALIIGYISDSYGRKPTFIIVIAAQILLGTLSFLSPNWPVFAAFRFLIGCCAGAEMVAGWVLAAEWTTNRYRYLIRVVAATTIVPFDQVFLAYMTGNWKWYSVIGNLQGIPLLIMLVYLAQESPRWLLQKGRVAEAEAILRKIAKINRSSDALPEKLGLQIGDKEQAKTRPWDLFRTRKLSIFTIISVLTWFLVSTVSYGMYFNTSYLPANIYLSMTILGLFGLLELPVAISDAYNPKLNRKWTLLVSLAITVICNVGIVIFLTFASQSSFGSYDIVLAIINVIGQVAVNVVFDQAYVYAVELFPALLRSTAGSLCSVGARLGAVIAPQVLYLHVQWPAAPYVFFAIFGFLCAIVDGIFLPNTKNMHLADAR